MARIKFDPADATGPYANLEKAEQTGDTAATQLLDAIDNVLDGLEENPAASEAVSTTSPAACSASPSAGATRTG